MNQFEAWFASRGWTPWPFQREAWAAFGAGRDGLIHVPTGAGKTYAAFGGPFLAWRGQRMAPGPGLRIIYVTPLRALSRDIEAALQLPLRELGIAARVESRTGDTSAAQRTKQRKELPEILVTTPESLALLIAREDAKVALAGVGAVIVDEWHELVASKRGLLLQLTLARLRTLSPTLRTWGVSATLRDPELAARALAPVSPERDTEALVVWASMPRPLQLNTLVPDSVDPLPWAGHLGLSLLPRLIAALNPATSNLIFTNTRSQAERWHQALLEAKPEWAEILAVHHGSLDRARREEIEDGLKSGQKRLVVATSSLDLGVDFPHVEHVFQIGSPKGVARLLQRAGRSSHRPFTACNLTCVPTHGMELLEFGAARRAVDHGRMEARCPPPAALDVLAQHLVSCALGGGFTAESILREVQTAWSYRELTPQDLDWVLRFLTTGGNVLDAYPNYRRLGSRDGTYCVLDKRQAQLHRLNIGTIASDQPVLVKTQSGQRLGYIDEAYLGRLNPGDRFLFAGRTLELVKVHELSAVVKAASGKITNVPTYQGNLLSLSMPMGDELRELLSELSEQRPGALSVDCGSPEIAAAAPILAAQRTYSVLPKSAELLFETWAARDGHYWFIYPFAGRAVNEALAALLALRLTRRLKATLAIVANDYGCALVSSSPLDFKDVVRAEDFSVEGLSADLAATVNAAQSAKKYFREIARIAGIVRQAYPGQRKGGRAVHVSSSLLFDTLDRFDPGHPLVAQAKSEAAAAFTGHGLLAETLPKLQAARWRWMPLRLASPLAFPLIVERVRARLSSESLAERVAKMQESWLRHEAKDRGKRCATTPSL